MTTAAAGGSRRGMERTPKASFSLRVEQGERGYYGRGVGAECSEVEGIGGGLKLSLHPLERSGVFRYVSTVCLFWNETGKIGRLGILANNQYFFLKICTS